MDEKDRKKTIRTFAAASFLNDLGSDIIYPIWPLFLTTVLGANMSVLGLIDGLGEAIVSISQAVSGYLSDRIRKRKVFVWTGYLFGSLSRIGYGLSTVWQQVIPFRVLDRGGKIRGAPRDAIIADISTNQNRGKNFGFLRTLDNFGAVCGIIICILFFQLLGYRTLFLLAAIPSAVAVILVFVFIKERKSADKKIYKGLRLKDLDKNFRLFLFLSALFALGSFSYSFLLIYAKEFGFEIIFVPVLYLIFTIFAALFSLPFGKLSDKVGRKKVLFISYALWGLVCLGFIFIHSYLGILLIFVFYGMHRAGMDTVQKTFVCELVPVEYRASGLGGFQMVIGLCALPASLIAGILWDEISIATPLYFSIGLTVVSAILLLLVKEEKTKKCY
jgi:MFS family permease